MFRLLPLFTLRTNKVEPEGIELIQSIVYVSILKTQININK